MNPFSWLTSTSKHPVNPHLQSYPNPRSQQRHSDCHVSRIIISLICISPADDSQCPSDVACVSKKQGRLCIKSVLCLIIIRIIVHCIGQITGMQGHHRDIRKRNRKYRHRSKPGGQKCKKEIQTRGTRKHR